MKKALSLLMAMLITASIFAAGAKEPAAAQAAGTPEDPVTIDLWFGAAITEAGMIPEDWIGYDILRNEHGIDLTRI